MSKKRNLRKILPNCYGEQYPAGWLDRFDEYPVWQDRVNAVRLGPKVVCRGCGKKEALAVPYYDGLCERCWCSVLWYCMSKVHEYFEQHPDEFFKDHEDSLLLAVKMIDQAKNTGKLRELVGKSKELK